MTNPRLPIVELGVDTHRVVDEVLLVLSRDAAGLYSRGGTLVRVRERVDGAPVVEALPRASLLETITRHVRCARRSTKDGEDTLRSALPSREVVDAIDSRGTWPLPELRGVASSPTLRPDGTVADQPGFDERSGLLLTFPSGAFPPVPERPSQEDARRALGVLLEPFKEFPYVNPSDRAAALALVLTLVARAAIEGPTPIFGVSGTDRGSGKTLLSQTAAVIATGSEVSPWAQCDSPEEEAKRLLGSGLEAAPLVIVDNVERAFGSDVLALAATSRTFKGRLLGTSRVLEVPVPVFAVTGNGLSIKGDLARRILPVFIDPKTERPDERTGFAIGNLIEWTKTHRPRLVVAALTILRAFVVAGRPQAKVKPIGSFEAWSALVRQSLLFAGEADACAGRDRLREEADSALAELGEVLVLWREKWGGEGVSAAVAVETAGTDLRTALASLARTDLLRLDGRRLGYSLRRVRGRVVGGLRFDLGGATRSAATLWRVVDIHKETSPASPTNAGSSPASPADLLHDLRQTNDAPSPDLRRNAGHAGDKTSTSYACARAPALAWGSPASPASPADSLGWVADPDAEDRDP